jgi:hypothetical protein
MPKDKKSAGQKRSGRSSLKDLTAPSRNDALRVMERYFLDFGQGMSNLAKRSNETSDEKQKKQFDIEGSQCSFVVTMLNEILASAKN